MDRREARRSSRRRSSDTSASEPDQSPDARNSRRSRKKERMERRKAKERIKNEETPAERRARRLQKRRDKEARRKEREISAGGFSNEANPFGDSELSNVFVWTKKHEKEAKKDRDFEKKERKRLEKRKREVRQEIEHIKKRREDREREQDEINELRDQMQREAEIEANADWDRKEDAFHKEQWRMRSKIRIREGRPRPIDILAKNLFIVDREERKHRPIGHGDEDDEEDLEVDLFGPYAVFQGLEEKELVRLTEDIESFVEMEEHAEYWEALGIICADELEHLRAGGAAFAAVAAVRTQIERMLTDKNADELEELERDVQRRVTGADSVTGVAVDIDYWEALSARLKVAKAKCYLAEFHRNLLQQRLEQLDTTELLPQPEEQGRVVPRLEEKTTSSTIEACGGAEPTEDPDVDEEQFSQEVQLPEQVYAWHDKYRPRRPLFFNKVKIGFEWSKYNQTHYDRENPPPKVVQGYKFNIFYPDLIDPSKPPTFRFENIPNDPDFCIIRFHSGPPYEDIAFKIVKKEWENTNRRGHKCKFEKGTLHLHFNFKRYRYRR